jgi:hypothetical protein
VKENLKGPLSILTKKKGKIIAIKLSILKTKNMSHQIIQNCGTACCDCTVACKYHFIEDLCAQDDELFAHYLSRNKDLFVPCLIATESMVGEVEIVIIQKVERLLTMGVNKIRQLYFDRKKQNQNKKALLNTEKIITILG